MSKWVEFANGVVTYCEGGEEAWSVSLSDVRVVGELTLPADLIRDDYFLVLVGADSWFLVPFGADGVEGLIDELSERLGCELEFRLAPEVELRSRVLGPPPLVGRKLFDTSEIEAKGIRRVVERILGTASVELSLAKEVQEALT